MAELINKFLAGDVDGAIIHEAKSYFGLQEVSGVNLMDEVKTYLFDASYEGLERLDYNTHEDLGEKSLSCLLHFLTSLCSVCGIVVRKDIQEMWKGIPVREMKSKLRIRVSDIKGLKMKIKHMTLVHDTEG